MQKTNRVLSYIAAMGLSLQATAQIPWSNVGPAGFSDTTITYTSLKKDKNGTLYVAWGDYSKGLKATVMKYDGSNWIPIGSKGFSAGWVALTTLAIDDNGTPLLAFEEYVNTQYKTTVMKYDGAGWVRLGNFGPSTGNAAFISLAINKAGTPYFAYRNSGIVMKFDGANWMVVGSGGASIGDANYISLAFDNYDTLYVAYSEANNGNKTTVKKFDGANWVTVGNTGFSNGAADFVSIKIDNNGTPYVAYSDDFAGKRSTVMKYDGTNWVTVGQPGFSTGKAGYVSFEIDNGGTPYVAFQDNSKGSKVSVMKYDGTRWVNVGNAGFSASGSDFNSMTLDNNGTPVVAYRDYGNGGRATVMKYNCPYPQVKINICAVLTDTITGKNLVVWNGSSGSYIDSYTIYRENWGSYHPIGRVAGNTHSFIDTSAYPPAKSYKYKLTLQDSCFRVTYLDSSAMHETARLIFNYLLNGEASISWNKYQGLPNLTYVVMRSNNGASFIPVDSFGISGTDTTYLDINPPTGINRYRIDIPLMNSCSTGSIIYNKITSNIVSSWNTGISRVSGGLGVIRLTPNPAGNIINVSTEEDIVKISVFDMMGKKLISERGNGEKEVKLDLSILPSGVYLLKINDIHNASFVKQ